MKNLIFFLTVILVSISTFMYSQTTYDMWGPETPNQILKVNMLDPGIGSSPKLIMEPSGIYESNGNIGIGLSSPTAKLHVDGTILSNNDISGTNIIGSIKTQSIQPAILPNKLTITAKPTESRFICQSNGEFSLGRINDSFNNQYGLFEIGNLGSSSYALSIHSETNGLVIKTEEEVYELATPISVNTWDGATTFKVKGNGDIYFNGTLFQNNQEFVEGKWQEQGNDIYFPTNNVGIGFAGPISSPNSKLHVYEMGPTGPVLRLENFLGIPGSPNYCWDIENNANVFAISYGAGSLGGSNPTMTKKMVINAEGKIGIGTETPSELLHVNGNQLLSGTLNVDGTSFLNGIVLDNDADITNADQIIGFNDLKLSGDANDGTDLFINADGNIGIGLTPSNNYKLEVNGKGHFEDNVSISGEEGNHHSINLGNLSGTPNSKLYTNGNAYFTGSVAIGTWPSTFDYALEVNGTIVSSEIIVENPSRWHDYVFDKDYVLPTLNEVEEFIKINKHLPDIPSESQIMEEGINVAVMNGLLLKKVEELTLYIIDLEKRIDEIQNQ